MRIIVWILNVNGNEKEERLLIEGALRRKIARTVREGPRGQPFPCQKLSHLKSHFSLFGEIEAGSTRSLVLDESSWKERGRSSKRDLAIPDVPLSRGNRLYAPISVPRLASLRIFRGKSSFFSQIPVQIPFVIRSGDSTSGRILLVGPATRPAKSNQLQAPVIFFFTPVLDF